MKWHKFWVKHKEKEFGKKESKESVNSDLLDVDFFCQLSYMAAIATSGIERSGLFSYASKLPYVSARYFKRVVFVARAFNHDYAEACNIVGQATKELQVKEFLLRLSGALLSGEDIATFLERESQVFSESYSNSYERRLDSLAKWTDAYVALIMTTAIVTVMAVVTMMIGNATVTFIISLSVITILITIAGAWMIYRAAPKETKVHSLPYRSKEQDLARHVARIVLPAGGLILLFMLVMKVELGWIMLTGGVFLFPLGLISKIDDNKITRRDTDIAGFLRSLGGVSQATGVTVNEAMGRLDFRAMGCLAEDVGLLYTRLLARIDPSLCWDRFVCDTGSEQVSRSVRIFWDAVTLGGKPQKIGNAASNFAMKISLLRAKRGMIGTGFLWLTVTMHIVLTGLLIFIYQTLITFTNLIKTIAPEETTIQSAASMPTFTSFNTASEVIDLLYFMIVAITIVLTMANAVAIYSITGGHIYNLAFYSALTVLISGAALVFVPPIVDMLFNSIM